jgi:hypothetical protein
MQKIINKYNDYLNVIETISKGKLLFISTYGLSINTQLERILRNASDFKMMVGVYERYCFPDCPHCKENIANNKAAILNYQKEFGGKRIIGVNQLHKKAVISNGHVIIGGFNLTNSQFIDNAMISDSFELYEDSVKLFIDQFYNSEKSILDSKVITTVTFGKYRGKLFEEMHKDKSYINYMHSVMDGRSFTEKMRLPY